MFKLTIPIKLKSSLTPNDIYRIYYTSLPKFISSIKYFANKCDSHTVNDKLLNLKNVSFIYDDKDHLFRDIILSIINQLYVYQDVYGCTEYRINPKYKNKFTSDLTFDQLVRLLEFGNESIKPLMILHSALSKTVPSIKETYKLIYDVELSNRG